MEKKVVVKRLLENNILSLTDIHFAGFLESIAGESLSLFLAAALCSARTREGHICFDLKEYGNRELLSCEDEGGGVLCPEAEGWAHDLATCKVVGKPGEFTPLVLENSSRLYLFRYWDYQKKMADFITERVAGDASYDEELLKQGLTRLFFGCAPHETDWQKVAAALSVVKRFSVISGGPGTGKTTTVIKILVLLMEQFEKSGGGKPVRIALIAPTGKAAARLGDSIKNAKGTIDCEDHIRCQIPEEATTIHRLLVNRTDSPYFAKNSENKLDMDVIIVDEASMVDLALMSKLVQAIPKKCRLILLGDQDQLASVEAGAVLGDICNTGANHHYSSLFAERLRHLTGCGVSGGEGNQVPVADSLALLRKSYRFGESSGIGAVSRAVNFGDDDLFIKSLKDAEYGDISFENINSREDLIENLEKRVVEGFSPLFETKGATEIFEQFQNFTILCAVRNGDFGTEAVNGYVERLLRREDYIGSEKIWYPGRPVMITENDYNLGLFNGDMGITLWAGGKREGLRVCFRDAAGEVRSFHPMRIPRHETVYAMTVHKSQGSEFDNVLLILPGYDTPVLTRELIYTAVTRARKSVGIWSSEKVVRFAVKRRIERASGLRDHLWEQGSRQE